MAWRWNLRKQNFKISEILATVINHYPRMDKLEKTNLWTRRYVKPSTVEVAPLATALD